MPKDTTTADSNANKVFDMPVNLKPGEVNTLSFPQDSIKSMNLTSENNLEISFRDGSKIEVENFQELVNSAQSCGRDTIIQLSDNTIIYPEELNTQLAQGPVSFGGGKLAAGEAQDGVFDISMPRAGQVIERDVSEGSQYKLGFGMGDAVSAAQAGQNLILTFADGGVLVLKNYFPATTASNPAQFSFANGNSVDTAALLSSCKLVEVASVAEGVAAGAPMIEPAAGEEVAEKAPKVAKVAKKAHVADVEPAAGEEVVQKGPQDIEPAAGDSGAQLISGNRGGFGFASSLQDVTFATSNPIGPIGPTALGYDRPDFPVGQITGTLIPFSLPPTPTPLPSIGPSTSGVDETNFSSVGGNTTGGTMTATNGPVTFAFNDGFGISGSVAGGRLTSCGEPVIVTRNGNTFTAKTAGGADVFTLVINENGTYTYTQTLALDHADSTNPDDVMTLTFGVTGTNAGGSSTSFISINVRDDGPVAVNDTNTVGSAPLTVSGNVLTNDNAGEDGEASLVSFTFEGTTKTFTNGQPVTFETTRGTLVVNQDGTYTYTSKNANLGTDLFSYVMRDCDGDTSSANLSIAVTDIDTTPIFLGSAVQVVDDTNLGPNVVNGNVPFDFKADAPGVITANGQFSSNGDRANNTLTSNGVAVTVSFDVATNTYTGTANGSPVFTMVVRADGTYTFTQHAQLDHSDPTTQADSINLVFGVTGTDSDGDTATGTVTVKVLDDAPLAVNDTGVVNPANNTATGNVMTNDDLSNDGVDTVIAIKFGNQTVNVPSVGTATINGAFGVMTIAADGSYTYVANNGATGTDVFTYTIRDFDGDTSSANINFNIADSIPTISGGVQTIDETNFGVGGASVNGTYAFSYGADGKGATGAITHSFVGAEGNVAGGNLSSGGVPVTVTKVGNVYTGTANGVTVFTMTINTDGTYNYSQVRPFDHSDTTNTNEGLALRFRLNITDADGDTDQTPANNDIVINVLDDAPVAANDGNSVTTPGGTVNGNVMTNDTVSRDAATTVVQVKFGNQTINVPTTGEATINGAFGVLKIKADGSYTYTANPASGGTDTFSYVIRDADGDTSQANLSVSTTRFDDVPTISGNTTTIDETNYTFGSVVNGTYAYNYGADGAGSITTSYVGSEGSVPTGGLRSGGVPVTVAQSGNTYIGTANGVEVFRVVINTNGTYTYTQSRPLDHADGTNPNDQLALRFRLNITDADGDTDQTPANNDIVINVLDDGPSISDGHSVSDDDYVGSGAAVVNGSLTGINFGKDGAGSVTGNGAFQVYKADGTPLTLHSGGIPVLISYNATTGTYSGTANGSPVFTLVVRADGTYTFTQQAPFDHQNPQDTDDANFYLDYIDMAFGATIRDGDNDSDDACIHIRVSDSGPDARNDGNTVTTPGSTVGGNVMTNDVVSKDALTTVYWIKFGNNPAVQVPTTGEATINGAFGVLKIKADGTYTYTADPSKSGTDVFSYTLVDRDGDYDHANLSISTTRFDDVPTISGNTTTIDETNYTFGSVVNGTYAYNYGADGAGSITTSYVGSEGSVPTGGLRSGGVPVTVAQSGNTYIGTANGVEVFRVVINTNGTYTYTQSRPLDHADGTNPNDQLALRFRLNITDADGDTDQTPANNDIVINVLDDAPVAANDGAFNVASGANFVGATTLLANDTLSRDGSNTVIQVKFGNQTVNVPATGSTTINGAFGVLTVRADGTYSYKAGTNAGGTDTFAYVVRDADGDTSQANVTFNAAAPTPFGVVVEAHHSCGYEDSCAVLDFKATRTGGDGDEVITVRVEGIPAGWRVEYPLGTFGTVTGGVWTYTLAAGQNFVSDPNLGGVKLWPPANSDADLTGLRFTATIHDPDTNTNAAGNVALADVTIDAVVDVPEVTATVGNVVNGQAAVNVTASLNDTDGSESLTVIRLMAVNSSGQLVGLPYGITFNKGHAVGGEWHLTTAELVGLKMNVPSWFTQDFRLGVMAVAEETSAGQGTNREFDYTNNATYDLYVVDHAVHYGTTSGSSLTVTSSASTSNTSASGSVTLNSFNAAEGDTLDISNVISSNSATDQAINDFVYANSTNVTVQTTSGNVTVQGVNQVNMDDIITLAQVNQNNGQI